MGPIAKAVTLAITVNLDDCWMVWLEGRVLEQAFRSGSWPAHWRDDVTMELAVIYPQSTPTGRNACVLMEAE